MKTRILPNWLLGLGLALANASVGFAQDPASPPASEPKTIAPAPAPAPIVSQTQALSPLAEFVKLARAGSGEELLLAFVHNAAEPFNLDANGIILLHNLGVSSPVLIAMLQQDAQLRSNPSLLASAAASESAAMSDAEPSDDATVLREEEEESPAVAERYPVRKPYPVRLLDPIMVYPLELPTPNVQILSMWP